MTTPIVNMASQKLLKKIKRISEMPTTQKFPQRVSTQITIRTKFMNSQIKKQSNQISDHFGILSNTICT